MIYPAAKVFADDVSLYTRAAPSLRYRSFRVGAETGPANLKLDRGEAADLNLLLRNAGAPVGELEARLMSRSPVLTIIDPTGRFDAVGEGDTTASTTDWFRVSAASTAPIEVPVHCDLVLSATGYSDTILIPVVVGDSMNLPTGPDDYGYVIYDETDSCYDRVPEYDWFEINRLGTELRLGEDETAVLPLPDDFGTWRYYGQDYDSISVCCNGFVVPGASDRVDFVNVLLPYRGSPPNIVAVCWENLHPPDYGHVWYYHDSAHNRLIVEFDSLPYFGNREEWEEVQVHVYDQTVQTPTGDNSIMVHLKTFNSFESSTIGLQNHDGSTGLTQFFNDWYPRTAAPLGPGRSVRIETTTPLPVSERSAAGTLSLLAGPNPFTTVVCIRLTALAPGVTAVRIYSAEGRLVRTLSAANGREAGWTWDGHDELGNRLSPGTYFARASCPSGNAGVKLILLAR